MGLTFSKTSKKALKAMEEGLKYMPRQMNQMALLKTSRQSQPESLPHKTYVIALEDIVSGAGLDKAQHVGWEHIVDGHAIVVHSNEATDQHEFAEINENVHLQGILKKLEVMKNHKKVIKGNFEVAILAIPSLYVKALWLRAEKREDDLLIPIEPTLPVFSQHPTTVFTPTDFVQLLKQEGVLRTQFDHAPVSTPDEK